MRRCSGIVVLNTAHVAYEITDELSFGDSTIEFCISRKHSI